MRFGERIVHGLYTASLISAVIGMRLPGPGAVYISQTLNFRGPVKIGDVIDVSVEVAELRGMRSACPALDAGVPPRAVAKAEPPSSLYWSCAPRS